MPIDTLKIDRSFVRELETSSDNAAIVAAIIAMSKSLKLRVVAEGVETQGQMTRLFDQGCQLMQGFLFSPAVPGDDFPSMLKASTSQSHWRIDFGPRARNKSASDGTRQSRQSFQRPALRRARIRSRRATAPER